MLRKVSAVKYFVDVEVNFTFYMTTSFLFVPSTNKPQTLRTAVEGRSLMLKSVS